ncbi:hypothetical protein Acor_80840 [Acrocarpospora corrugata]|uniref:Uncharacterized protein n=1 Tax=Acrocarpospora corrugata TaxID=35763 RepID=A0A5M3WAE4_9ACTN|nr:hypothetical protein Acor_80840 [Acrocarpospora corrugata]
MLRERSGKVTVLRDAKATRAAVTAALGDHRRAHFACHARSDLDDPSAGHLLLHDGVFAVAEDITGEDDLAGAASALNRAIRDQRDLIPDKPWAWAAHVHCGP